MKVILNKSNKSNKEIHKMYCKINTTIIYTKYNIHIKLLTL